MLAALTQKSELESQLIESAKTDGDAFAQLYDFYFPRVYAFTMSKVSDRELAEDIVSEIFMKVLDNLPKYQDRGLPFTAWLFTISRHVIFDHYAKRQKQQSVPLEENLDQRDDDAERSPTHTAAHSELSEQVRAVMAKLPERDLTIVQLKFFAGLNNREIAATLNLSESNVGIILFRVLRKMKPDLANLY